MTEEQRKEYTELQNMIEAYCSGYLHNPSEYLEKVMKKMKEYKEKWNLP